MKIESAVCEKKSGHLPIFARSHIPNPQYSFSNAAYMLSNTKLCFNSKTMAFFSTLQEFQRTLRYLGSLIALKYLGSLGAALRSTPRTWSSPPSRESSLAKVILVMITMQMMMMMRLVTWAGNLPANFCEIICEYLWNYLWIFVKLFVNLCEYLWNYLWIFVRFFTWAGNLPASLSSSSALRLSRPESSTQPAIGISKWNIFYFFWNIFVKIFLLHPAWRFFDPANIENAHIYP